MKLDDKTKTLLLESSRLKSPVYLSGDNLDITFETRVKKLDDTQLMITNKVAPQFITRLCASKKFSVQCRTLRLESEKIGSDGESILFPFAKTSIVSETRQAERFSFTKEERVICQLINPFDGETQLAKSVIDMSATGLSLRTNFESHMFIPGTILGNMRVLIDGKVYSKATGKVVYRRKLIDIKGHLRLQVGVQFLPQ